MWRFILLRAEISNEIFHHLLDVWYTAVNRLMEKKRKTYSACSCRAWLLSLCQADKEIQLVLNSWNRVVQLSRNHLLIKVGKWEFQHWFFSVMRNSIRRCCFIIKNEVLIFSYFMYLRFSASFKIKYVLYFGLLWSRILFLSVRVMKRKRQWKENCLKQICCPYRFTENRFWEMKEFLDGEGKV